MIENHAALIILRNMFLRWMIRNYIRGVDFEIGKSISPSKLSCLLDIHSGNIAGRLGLITRKQNDSGAVSELDKILRKFDRDDPVKYDFVLFGLGISEKPELIPLFKYKKRNNRSWFLRIPL